MITFRNLRRLLVEFYFCEHVLIVAEDEVWDPTEDQPCCAVHGFVRHVSGLPLLSTIAVIHEDLALHPSELRPFLDRLRLSLSDIGL